MQAMPTLYIRYDIDKVGGGLYGLACYANLFEAIPADMLEGLIFYDGDSAATLAGRENVNVIALQSADQGRLAAIRNVLEQHGAFQAVAASPALQVLPSGGSDPLVLTGVMSGGSLSGENTWAHAALSDVKKKRERAAEAVPAPAVTAPPPPAAPPAQVIYNPAASAVPASPPAAPAPSYGPGASPGYAQQAGGYTQQPGGYSQQAMNAPKTSKIAVISVICAVLAAAWMIAVPFGALQATGSSGGTKAAAARTTERNYDGMSEEEAWSWKAADNLLLTLKAHAKNDALVTAVLETGDYDAFQEAVLKKLEGKDFSKKVTFSSSLKLSDVSRLSEPDIDLEDESQRVNYLEAKLENLAATRSFTFSGFIEDDKVSWTTSYLDTATGRIQSDLDKLFTGSTASTSRTTGKSTTRATTRTTTTTATTGSAAAQSMPSSGDLTVVDASSYGSVKIITPNNVYIKFYTEDEQLVKSVFVRKDASYTTKLPKGTFHINVAMGDTWYGEDDKFGDSGQYQRLTNKLTISETSQNMQLTLSVTSGGNTGSRSVNKDNF